MAVAPLGARVGVHGSTGGRGASRGGFRLRANSWGSTSVDVGGGGRRITRY